MFRRMIRCSSVALVSSVMWMVFLGSGFAAENSAAVPAVEWTGIWTFREK